MYVLTADEMREMDRSTIEDFGLPGRVLMENAGRGAARVLMKAWPDLSGKPVGIIAGRGNNGGDGFVIARYLVRYGIKPTVYLLSEGSRLSGDAAANFSLLAPSGITVREMPDESCLETYKTEMIHQALWVDAILGTGLNSEVKGYFKTIIEFINNLKKPVLAVDIASGLHTDTGRPCGACIRADVTATFAYPKLGHVLFPGAACTGRLHVIDIGIPDRIASAACPRQHLITPGMIRKQIKPRPGDMHKGQTGHLLVLAGAPGKSGAAVMSALSALRAGAGLVTLGVPESIRPVVEARAIEVMTIALPCTASGALDRRGADDILKRLPDKKCLALGPGIGAAGETRDLVRELVTRSPVPVVVDADGINNLAADPAVLKDCASEIVLTPHPGEMARLIDSTPGAVQEDRIGCARRFAQTYHVHLILKGARTVTARPDGHVYVNLTGNPGMASAGMGDVLTGMVAGFICQGYPPDIAAQIAVFVHGAAADRISATRPAGYIASDVITAIPDAMAGIRAEKAASHPLESAFPVRHIL